VSNEPEPSSGLQASLIKETLFPTKQKPRKSIISEKNRVKKNMLKVLKLSGDGSGNFFGKDSQPGGSGGGEKGGESSMSILARTSRGGNIVGGN